MFFVFGAHAFVWGTTSVTIRQRAVPTQLQGRVGSVNLVGVFGGLVVGAAIGGLLAQRYGVTAPFWFAFVGSAIFVVLIWHQLRHVAHTDEQDAPEPTLDVCIEDVQYSDVTTTAMGAPAAEDVARALRALADPLRLRALSLITASPSGEACVLDISELTAVSQPTVSHHLKVLRDAGIVTSERRGTWVWYRLAPEHREAVRAVLGAFAAVDARPAEAIPDLDRHLDRVAADLAPRYPTIDAARVRDVVRDSATALARTSGLGARAGQPDRAVRAPAPRRPGPDRGRHRPSRASCSSASPTPAARSWPPPCSSATRGTRSWPGPPGRRRPPRSTPTSGRSSTRSAPTASPSRSPTTPSAPPTSS